MRLGMLLVAGLLAAAPRDPVFHVEREPDPEPPRPEPEVGGLGARLHSSDEAVAQARLDAAEAKRARRRERNLRGRT